MLYVKDLITKEMVLSGQSRGGLVFTLCMSLLQPCCPKPSYLHVSLLVLISGIDIVDLGTLICAF